MVSVMSMWAEGPSKRECESRFGDQRLSPGAPCPLQKPASVYLDNACTSYPKPPCVADAVVHYLSHGGYNVNRASYEAAYDVEDGVLECRELLADMFGVANPGLVAFTRCVTESLNLVIKGLLKPGDHVVVSSMEHNAVMRSLTQLASRDVTFTRVSCAEDGSLDVAQVERALTPATRLVVMTHASNVCGTVLPLGEVGELAHAHGIPFVVDAAQTAGVLDVSLEALHADAVCFTGHKGLLGPQGIGGVALTAELAGTLDPLVVGGTGSFSDSEETPSLMPDKLEAGTLNLPGIMGLSAGLRWLGERGVESVRAHELDLTERLIEALLPLEAQGFVGVVGRRDTEGRVGVVSVTTPGLDCAMVAHELDARHGVQTRVGLHCAPSAHKSLGTFPTGTIRFSVGPFNTSDDVDAAVAALADACRHI